MQANHFEYSLAKQVHIKTACEGGYAPFNPPNVATGKDVLKLNRSRNIQLKLYINEQEQNALENMMESYEGNKSEYIRDCIFKANALDIQSFNKNVTELIKQYKAIGNNLNQITRAMHQGNINIEKNEILEIRKELEKLWQLLKSLKVGEV